MNSSPNSTRSLKKNQSASSRSLVKSSGANNKAKKTPVVPLRKSSKLPSSFRRLLVKTPSVKEEIEEPDKTDHVFITSFTNNSQSLRPPSPFIDYDDEYANSRPKYDDYTGEESYFNFWKFFKHQEKFQRSRVQRPESPRTTYMEEIRKSQLAPEPMGIVRKTHLPKIDIHSYQMGNRFGKAFAESFSLVPGIKTLNLSSNRINDETGEAIISKIPSMRTLCSLDISRNNIAQKSIKILSSLIISSKVLTYINLEHNQLNSTSISTLCEALKKNQTVTRLNLSENKFSTPGMVSIAKLLEENSVIEEMYLSWNKIRGIGAQRIVLLVESISYHRSLRVLDLSWNSLSSCTNHVVSHSLADSLSNNRVLLHLDISNNNLDHLDCTALAKQLEHNNTLAGIHMMGNQASIDSKGFVIPHEGSIQLQQQHKFCSIMQYELSQSEDLTTAIEVDKNWAFVDRNCWLCGRWSEYRFVWHPKNTNTEINNTTRVTLHLSIDSWKGDQMVKQNDGSFSLYRILPPGKSQYFITVVVNPNDDPIFFINKEKKHSSLFRKRGEESTFGPLYRANYIEMPRYEGRNPCNSTTPRPSGNAKIAQKWDLRKSVFASRPKEAHSRSFWDTDAFMQKAFTADWKQCKIDRIVKDSSSQKDLELLSCKNFRTIVDVYRKYCARSTIVSKKRTSPVEMNCVTWGGFSEFLNDCELLDESLKGCKLSDMDNVFVAANLELSTEDKEKDNPDRSLTRFEFLECIIRISINKYIKSGLSDSPMDAFMNLMDDHITRITPENSDVFRANYLYKEEVSNVFSENVVMLRKQFTANMGKYCRPGDKKGMTIMEFIDLMENVHVFDDSFRPRDVKEPFLLSKMTVTDEMTTTCHKKIFFTEFMELLLRIALFKEGIYNASSTAKTDALDIPDPLLIAQKLEAFLNKYFCHHESESLSMKVISKITASMSDTVEKASNQQSHNNDSIMNVLSTTNTRIGSQDEGNESI